MDNYCTVLLRARLKGRGGATALPIIRAKAGRQTWGQPSLAWQGSPSAPCFGTVSRVSRASRFWAHGHGSLPSCHQIDKFIHKAGPLRLVEPGRLSWTRRYLSSHWPLLLQSLLTIASQPLSPWQASMVRQASVASRQADL